MTVRPAASGQRLVGVDLARAVALLGMMLAHLGPSWTGFDTPPASEWLASGRAAPLFAVLAGVSVGLMERLDPGGVGSRSGVARRGAALLVIGLALAALPNLTVLVILPCYAVLVAATVLVRRLSTPTLVATAAAWCALSPIALWAVRHAVDEPFTTRIQPSWAGGLEHLVVEVFVWGGYPAIVWLGYVLVGVAIARFDLTSRLVAARLAVVGGIAATATVWIAAVAVYLGALEQQWGSPRLAQILWTDQTLDPLDPTSWWAAGPHTSMPLNVVGAAGSSMLVIGLCLLVCRSERVRRLTTPLQAAGTMTLTLYCLHVALVWAIREHDLSFTGGTYSEWWVQAFGLVAIAWLYRRVADRGPLEHIVRVVSTPRRTPVSPQ